MDEYRRKLPKSALAFYIKVYCKKREETKVKNSRVLIEATKSWLSLSKTEKQQFISKYQEHKKCYRKTIAGQLKKAEPYLLKKINHKNKSDNSALMNDTAVNLHQVTDCKFDQPQINSLCNNERNALHISLDDTVGSSLPCPVNSHGSKNVQDPEVLEPPPPKLLSGRDLFNMINENDVNLWKTLPEIERRRYHNAVLTIKKNYLKDYKIFLEQLPSEKLFHYYKNIIKLQM